ncbi:low molecular weight phosphotyrosine protein phosphatase 2-like isoform X1 [Cotesia glomerata]|uniref:low molecular weight phosphotyrosine protein phosphatase 2-like isoform X1 n=1 Tax=Cotesia glomerata TaxID=32391 RepID=UPI001D00CDBA|nr:low molecular weight phosphotyrosine protein phosphatase 2-like isoform X1 [Cotesia glomerata]
MSLIIRTISSNYYRCKNIIGNTCRSTMAEAIFDDYITKMGLKNTWEVNSAGLRGYHAGQTPDERALVTLRGRGIVNYSHKARVITKNDFYSHNWIFGMDQYNIEQLEKIKPEGSNAKIELLGSYNPNGDIIIEDPFPDKDCRGFVKAFEQSNSSIKNFLELNSKK